ncbi:recombination protein NinG [Herbaspirillum sp. YR522]|uniref:recombination protein NinG n=1 Tax=Herbaspirillum sp. YR522 TaxID=1144342 RepID=UPI00026FA2A1|nr:recombination protein NinG [Herbaspirillum sp. YR522]EJN06467.1 Bacteriophage Lambda NinG protein [Herbaspirillum sp. YR522]
MMQRSPLNRKNRLKSGGGTTSKKFDQACKNALSGLTAKAPKPRKPSRCKVCRGEYFKRSITHKACGTDCAIELARRQREEAARRAQRADRVLDRAKREAMKSYGELIAEAQTAFNAFIRERDIGAGHGCIDCGKPFEPNRPGGSVDAGHYISRGAAPHLRFNENNCFAQRKNCNRPGGTTREAFRAGVEKRIGLAALEDLEADQSSPKWTHDDLRTIRRLYQLKLKDLRAARAEGQAV